MEHVHGEVGHRVGDIGHHVAHFEPGKSKRTGPRVGGGNHVINVAGCRTRERAARSKISEEGAAATVHCKWQRLVVDPVHRPSDRHGDRRT